MNIAFFRTKQKCDGAEWACSFKAKEIAEVLVSSHFEMQ